MHDNYILSVGKIQYNGIKTVEIDKKKLKIESNEL